LTELKKKIGENMNHWTQLSIDFANQRNYLDELFSVYPTIPEGIRDIDQNLWEQAERLFNEQNNVELLNVKTDVDAETIAILDGVLYIEGRNKIYRNITEELNEYNIMSSLVLRDFLYQI
jgi:hypothetical protein